ncbi:MAG: DUF2797 domain-containing protein [Halodesulfurarchaeum sp.]
MQIVGYEPGTPNEPAALRLAADGSVRSRPLLPGTDLDYGLGPRHCAGEVDGENHAACSNTEAPYCTAHTSTWPCAVCRGDCAMPLEACHEEHVVYLAAFEPATFKVGVTRSWRLERRLGEQGAARGAKIRTVENGRIARRIEADLATEIPDRVAVARKIEGVARAVDESAWESLLTEFDGGPELRFDYGLDLASQPIPATMAAGTVRGSRGRILVLERGESTYGVDLRDLVGHEVVEGGPTAQRQVSLRAFGPASGSG